MQFALSRTFIACALFTTLALAGAKKVQSQSQPQQQPQGAKLKRDAALSFGSGHYHGPSHKYLPPATVSTGYESTYGSLHGNGLSSSSGFDFASLDADSNHHHHHHQQQQQQQQLPLHHHYPQHPLPHHGHAQSYGHGHGQGHGRPVYIHSTTGSAGYHHQRPQAPKVETYIVQTSNSPGNSHHGHHGGQSGNGLGYKYAAGSGSAAGGFLSLLGSGKQQHGVSTYLLATPSYNNVHGHGVGHVQRPSLSSQHFAGLEQEEHSSGYSYEAPSLHFKQPLSSYGVPLLPTSYEHQPQSEEELSSGAEKVHGEPQTPAYALGHKGLGHFSYTSSKPQALHTDIHHHQHIEDHNEAPFKPSAFLGAKHEPSQVFDFATPTSQYLQPPSGGGATGGAVGAGTVAGYDYHAPSVLYGAPAQSGDSATPIFEPESTYLPPVSSYGAPATPTHSYH